MGWSDVTYATIVTFNVSELTEDGTTKLFVILGNEGVGSITDVSFFSHDVKKTLKTSIKQ